MTQEKLDHAKTIEKQILKCKDVLSLLSYNFKTHICKKKRNKYVLCSRGRYIYGEYQELPQECKDYVGRFYEQKIKELEKELQDL